MSWHSSSCVARINTCDGHARRFDGEGGGMENIRGGVKAGQGWRMKRVGNWVEENSCKQRGRNSSKVLYVTMEGP